jgi:hypothetical protein
VLADAEKDIAFRSDLKQKAVVHGDAAFKDVPEPLDFFYSQGGMGYFLSQEPQLLIGEFLNGGGQFLIVALEVVGSDKFHLTVEVFY